jgi:uncharacterized protein
MNSSAPQQDPPWYEDGLRFACTRCGKCCTGAPGFVWIDEEEEHAIADFLGEDHGQFVAFHTRRLASGRSLREKANGDCVFWDARQGCTIYPVRPRQCRTWPFWESNVQTPAAWDHTGAICPGAGAGALISAEEITRRVKVVCL